MPFNPFSRKAVTVLIPAYQAGGFVLETLDSLARQSFQDYRLIISVDLSEDATVDHIKKWVKRNKKIQTKVYVQDTRLGWVRNTNFLLGKVRSPYFMILPHDDLLGEYYLQKAFDILHQNTETSVVYSDLETFGLLRSVISQSSIKGNRMQRVIDFLSNHFNAVAFRGLVNRKRLGNLMYLPENSIGNFAIDTVWNLQMAIKGELIRIPEVLYHKRTLENSAHAQWIMISKDKIMETWVEHCRDCFLALERSGFDEMERLELLEAFKVRLFQEKKALWNNRLLSATSEDERIKRIKLFLEKVQIDTF